MDDPDAERDHHDAERIADYRDTVMDLANWLVPETPNPGEVEFRPDDDAEREWQYSQRLRALLTAELEPQP